MIYFNIPPVESGRTLVCMANWNSLVEMCYTCYVLAECKGQSCYDRSHAAYFVTMKTQFSLKIGSIWPTIITGLLNLIIDQAETEPAKQRYSQTGFYISSYPQFIPRFAITSPQSWQITSSSWRSADLLFCWCLRWEAAPDVNYQ